MTQVVLAVDAGSSRLRVSAVSTEDGAIVASAASATRSSGGELDVEGVWSDLRALVADVDLHGAEVRGVGVAAQLSTVLMDQRGRPVRPAMLWADVRAGREAAELAEILPRDAVEVAGRPLAPELPIAKLRWLAAHEPDVLGRTRWVVSLKDALVHRLTGRVVSDETHASYTGLYDVQARTWSRSLATAAGVDPGILPATAAGAASAGPLLEDVAAELGLPAGVAVAVGGPDGTLGAVGAGAVEPGVTVDVAGTTDVLLRTVDRPVGDPSGAAVLNAHVLPGLWTVGGPTGLTGGAVEWTARLLGFAGAREAHETLGDLAATAAGVDGLLFVPALAGTRFPSWRPGQTGVVVGLRAEHGPVHLLRAAHEGAAFTVGDGLRAIRDLGLPIDEVVIVGGAAARTATLQLRSDAWSTPVVALANSEATTVGAAMLAGVASGAFADPAAAALALVHRNGRHEPRPAAAEAFAAAHRRWHLASEEAQ